MKSFFGILLCCLAVSLPALAEYGQKAYPTTDKYGNEILVYGTKEFNFDHFFRHPNGEFYPDMLGKFVWVYAEPKRYSNYTGILSLAGLATGITAVYLRNQEHGFKDLKWHDWTNVGLFTFFAGGGITLGLTLDYLHKPKGGWPEYTYRISFTR